MRNLKNYRTINYKDFSLNHSIDYQAFLSKKYFLSLTRIRTEGKKNGKLFALLANLIMKVVPKKQSNRNSTCYRTQYNKFHFICF